MDRRTLLRGVSLAGVAAVGGCLDSRRTAGGDYDVGMSTVAFKPTEVTVGVDEEVVWRNTSKQGHTVTAYEEGLPAGAAYFASGGFETEAAAREAWPESFGGRISEGETYTHTFEVAGEYPYFCVPHERAGMTGSVVVEER